MNEKLKEIEDFYTYFFDECKRIDRCKQSEFHTKDKENHCYNHGLIYTKNFFESKKKILLIGQERKEESKISSTLYKFSSKMTKHWRGTLITVLKFFNKIKNEEIKGLDKEKIETLLQDCEFAFTNYYKCGFSVGGNFTGDMIHSDLMRIYCGKCLKNEIEILKPDLIIKQGITIPPIEELFNKYVLKQCNGNNNTKCKMYECEYSNGDKFYIINSYHPSRYWWWRSLKTFCEMIDYCNNELYS